MSNGSNVKVHIEYCNGCGYSCRFKAIQKAVLAEYPEAQVTGSEGRKDSFEITVNDFLVFSKLKMNGFPTAKAISEQVKEAADGGKPKEVTEVCKCQCDKCTTM